MESIKAWLAAHPTARSMIRVFVYTFLATFALTLTDFLGDVSEWASGDDVPFPDVAVLGKAAASAATAALSSVLAGIWNKLPTTKTAVYTHAPAPHDPPPLDNPEV